MRRSRRSTTTSTSSAGAGVPDRDAGRVAERAYAKRAAQLRPRQPDRDHLRVADGLAIAVSDREHREHLRDGWLDLKNGPVVVESPAEHARAGRRFLVSLRRRTSGSRGPTRARAASSCSCHLTTRARRRRATTCSSPDLQQLVRDARLPSERRSQAGRRRASSSSCASIRWRTPRSRRRRTSSTSRGRPSTPSMRWISRSSRK